MICAVFRANPAFFNGTEAAISCGMIQRPEGFHAVLDTWARRHGLSRSQRMLLDATALGLDSSLESHLRISKGEAQLLRQLFEQRTGRGVEVAVHEIERIALRRSSRPPTLREKRKGEAAKPSKTENQS